MRAIDCPGGACATVSATNLCLPSEALAPWQHLTTRETVVTT
jgi:hypothetical protein